MLKIYLDLSTIDLLYNLFIQSFNEDVCCYDYKLHLNSVLKHYAN